jgi:hypothetical protein
VRLSGKCMKEENDMTERRIDLAIALTKIEGRLKNIEDHEVKTEKHLERLNTFNRECLLRDIQNKAEFDDLKSKFTTHAAVQEEIKNTKDKISGKNLVILGLVISALVGFTVIYTNVTKSKVRPAEVKAEVMALGKDLKKEVSNLKDQLKEVMDENK